VRDMRWALRSARPRPPACAGRERAAAAATQVMRLRSNKVWLVQTVNVRRLELREVRSVRVDPFGLRSLAALARLLGPLLSLLSFLRASHLPALSSSRADAACSTPCCNARRPDSSHAASRPIAAYAPHAPSHAARRT
jgi:hypothetical protein